MMKHKNLTLLNENEENLIKNNTNLLLNSQQSIFNFNKEYFKVIENIVSVCDEFKHINLNHIAISYSKTHSKSKYGICAKIYPLRFEGGTSEKIKDNYKFSIPSLYVNNNEIYYVISFCIPRFLNLSLTEKLETIIHELFHISPKFNGDIRRLTISNKAAHGHNKNIFDNFIYKLVQRYLNSPKRFALPPFLYMDYKKLINTYKKIEFEKIKIPKINVEVLK